MASHVHTHSMDIDIDIDISMAMCTGVRCTRVGGGGPLRTAVSVAICRELTATVCLFSEETGSPDTNLAD